MKTRKQGFTLIELMISMTIIGILTAIGFTAYQASKKTARDGKRKADLEQIRSALEMYYTDNDEYPYQDIDDVEAELIDGDYMEAVQTDPRDPEYIYSFYSADGSTYCLGALLEAGGSGCDCGTLNCQADDCNYCLQNP